MDSHKLARQLVTEYATRYGHKLTRWYCDGERGYPHRSRCQLCGATFYQDGWGEMRGTGSLFARPCAASTTVDQAYVDRTINDRAQRSDMAQGVHPMYSDRAGR